MAYIQTQPIDEDLGDSRPKIVSNFTAIETYIVKDHVSFNGNTADSGLHKQITFNAQNTPAGASAANQGILYIEDAVAALKFMNSSGTAQTLTGGTQTLADPGEVNFANGLKLRFGTQTISDGNPDVTFNYSSAMTTALIGQVTQFGGTDSRLAIGALSNTGMIIKRSSTSGALTVYYLVLGT